MLFSLDWLALQFQHCDYAIANLLAMANGRVDKFDRAGVKRVN
jgi:hypothetical protein